MEERLTEDVFSRIEAKCDQMTMQRLSLFLWSLRSSLNYEFLGKTPRNVLDWIDEGRKEFGQDEKLMGALNELELKLYKEVDPDIYCETMQKLLEKMKPLPSYPKEVESVSYKEFQPIDLRDIPFKDLSLKLLEELRSEVPQDSLAIPIGKTWIKGRRKRDDLSKKNWPLFRKATVMIYDLLKPFYPTAEKKRKGKKGHKKEGPGLYRSQLEKDIVALMRSEFALTDITQRDVDSAIGYHFRHIKT